jgi:hypothetical protein
MSEHSTQPACEKQGLPAPVPHPANRHFKDITGQTFGRLTVRYYVGRRPWFVPPPSETATPGVAAASLRRRLPSE